MHPWEGCSFRPCRAPDLRMNSRLGHSGVKLWCRSKDETMGIQFVCGLAVWGNLSQERRHVKWDEHLWGVFARVFGSQGPSLVPRETEAEGMARWLGGFLCGAVRLSSDWVGFSKHSGVWRQEAGAEVLWAPSRFQIWLLCPAGQQKLAELSWGYESWASVGCVGKEDSQLLGLWLRDGWGQGGGAAKWKRKVLEARMQADHLTPCNLPF